LVVLAEFFDLDVVLWLDLLDFSPMLLFGCELLVDDGGLDGELVVVLR
jgi:hypothetical protein